MPTRKSLREYNATDLLKQWRSIVNQHVMVGRDARMLKDSLEIYTPIQLMLGMYNYQGENLTVPRFLKQHEEWLEEDEIWAEIKLAVYLTNQPPKDYYIYMDYSSEETSEAFSMTRDAFKNLLEWADKVLS